MPRIDTVQDDSRFTERIQQADIVASGQKTGAALEDLGSKMFDLSKHVLQARKANDDQTYAFNANVADQVATNQFTQNLQKQISPGAPGYANMVNQFLADRMDKAMANAPSEEAKNLYAKHATLFRADQSISASRYENTQRAGQAQQDIANANDALTKQYAEKPDFNQFQNDTELINRRIDAGKGILYSESDAEDMKKKAAEQRAVGVMEGLKAQELYNTGLRIMHDGFGSAGKAVKDAMSKETFAKYQEDFSNRLDQKHEVGKAQVIQGFADAQASITNGNAVDANALHQLVTQAIQNPKFTKDDKARLIDKTNTLIQVSKDTSLLNSLPRDKWDTLPSAQPDNKQWNAAQRNDVRGIFEAAKANLLKQQDTDPVTTTLYGNPALQSKEKQARDGNPQATQDYVSTSLQTQNALGIPNPKILSKPMAQFEANKINKATSPAAAAQMITQMSDSYGKYFPQMWNELVENKSKGGGGVDPSLAVVGFLPDPSTQARIVDNTRNADNIIATFNAKNAANPKFVQDQINLHVANETKDVVDTLASGSSFGGNAYLVKSIQHQVAIEAMNNMNNNQGMDAKDAVKEAYKSIVSNNFNTVIGGNSKILLPKQVGSIVPDKNVVQAAMSKYSEPEGFNELSVKVPKSFIDSHDGDKAKAKDSYYDYLSKTSRWVTTSDKSGIQLVREGADGLQAVLNSDGKPIQKSFQELNQDRARLIPDNYAKGFGAFIF